tara:strand:- start:5318 stop:6559 length:1242 start_codon:yes stop_codon:yes gene_type:complete
MSKKSEGTGTKFIEGVSLTEIASEFGTPSYLYSFSKIAENTRKYLSSVRKKDLVCYSVKSNSNLHILKLISDLGCGFDVVSGNELKRCVEIGADPKKIIFSGVGKSYEELKLAAQLGIYSINIESEGELERLSSIAKELDLVIDCAIRVNPDIASGSHPYIETGKKNSKFGLSTKNTLHAANRLNKDPHINLIGLAAHIGSQITNPSLLIKTLECLLEIRDQIPQKEEINFLDLGGGLGISYKEEQDADIKQIISEIIQNLENKKIKLLFEPGRSIVGNAGILLSKVEYIKKTESKNFAIIDAAMNDIMRPSLYDAWHDVTTVKTQNDLSELLIYDVAGPICESADILAKGRELDLKEGSLLIIKDVGAYGFSMSSNYNSRTRPAEILIKEGRAKLIRSRETFEDIIAQEKIK